MANDPVPYSHRYTIKYCVFKEAEVQRDDLDTAKAAIIDYENAAATGYKRVLKVVIGETTEFNNHEIENHPESVGS